MSFRKEIKFKLTFSDFISLKSQLLDNGMESLYPSRKVNSCYFDNHDYLFLNQSFDGIVPRKKVRLRWYDDNYVIKKAEGSIIIEENKSTDTLNSNNGFHIPLPADYRYSLNANLDTLLLDMATTLHFNLDLDSIALDKLELIYYNYLY